MNLIQNAYYQQKQLKFKFGGHFSCSEAMSICKLKIAEFAIYFQVGHLFQWTYSSFIFYCHCKYILYKNVLLIWTGLERLFSGQWFK